MDMLQRMDSAYDAGSTVVCTPHYQAYLPGKIIRGRIARVNRFLESASGRFKVDLLSAGELMIHGLTLDNLEETRYPGTDWVLVEFPLGVTWIETMLQVRRILKKGFHPLIAHPERYYWCRKRGDRLVKLSQMGCGVAVSARSLRLKNYASPARKLLFSGLAHVLCSDAHSISDHILDDKLKNRLQLPSEVSWDSLTREIPGLILENRSLPVLPLRRGEGF